MVDGKKVPVHVEKEVDGEGEGEGSGAGAGDGAGDGAGSQADDGDEGGDEQTQKSVKQLGKLLRKELGLDELMPAAKAAAALMNRPENAKLREILHGKDINQKDQLTKEEVITGFFHALVTRNEAAVKALSEGTAADGGNLFPAEFLSELVKSLTEPPYARSLVRVVTMRRNTMKFPTLTNRPKVYWTGENVAKTTTTANFGQSTLTAYKAAAIIYASDELIEDSNDIDVVRLIIDLFAEAIGIEENRVILAGNGTTQPMGIFTTASNSIGTIACSGNLDFDDLTDLVYALKSMYRPGASFLVNPENVKELRKLKDSQGRYIWEPAATAGTPDRILGYPVYEFYDADVTKIAFGNWKLAYWLGDRKQMTVKVSNDTETAFTKDQTAIRVVFRIGGIVALPDAAKVLTSIP